MKNSYLFFFCEEHFFLSNLNPSAGYFIKQWDWMLLPQEEKGKRIYLYGSSPEDMVLYVIYLIRYPGKLREGHDAQHVFVIFID